MRRSLLAVLVTGGLVLAGCGNGDDTQLGSDTTGGTSIGSGATDTSASDDSATETTLDDAATESTSSTDTAVDDTAGDNTAADGTAGDNTAADDAGDDGGGSSAVAPAGFTTFTGTDGSTIALPERYEPVDLSDPAVNDALNEAADEQTGGMAADANAEFRILAIDGVDSFNMIRSPSGPGESPALVKAVLPAQYEAMGMTVANIEDYDCGFESCLWLDVDQATGFTVQVMVLDGESTSALSWFSTEPIDDALRAEIAQSVDSLQLG